MKKVKTTVLLDAELWDRFLLSMHTRRKIRSQSLALETAIQEWLNDSSTPVPNTNRNDSPRTSNSDRLLSTKLARAAKIAAELNQLLNGETGDSQTKTAGRTDPGGSEIERTIKELEQAAHDVEKGGEALRAGKKGSRGVTPSKTGSA